MSYRHGVYVSEVDTAVVSPVTGYSGLPVVIGTAPIGPVNEPVLVSTYEEAVKAFGYSDDWDYFTLCEFMYSQFALYGQSPCVLVNVYNRAEGYTRNGYKRYKVVDHAVNIPDGIMYGLNEEPSNVYPRLSLNGTTQEAATYNTDMRWTSFHTDSMPGGYCNGDLTITFLPGGKFYDLEYVYIDCPVRVPISNMAGWVIGGYDSSTGKNTGLELVSDVFHKYRVVPGIILAPGFSHIPSVAAVMRAKADTVSGVFKCISLCDAPGNVYSEIPAWKELHNYADKRQILCWPKLKLGDKVYHMSTQLCGLMNRTDNGRGDVPYKSPSNELLQCEGCVNDRGDSVMLTLETANYLNSQGIVTALNWTGGWRLWGNRTCAYPANSDTKNVFIPVRRMFDYVGNTFINTFWQKADGPMTVRLIREIVNSFNLYLNGLAAREMILGGEITFREDENPITNLMDGKLVFHLHITPPVPAESIEGILEYDPEYLTVLYEAVRG